MYPDEVYANLRAWSGDTLILVRRLLPLVGPMMARELWPGEQRETLGDLLTAAARSSESALLLTASAQLWDAEILVRSAFEASLKFVYLLQDPMQFAVRYQEYRYALTDIALLKDHAKASDFLDLLLDRDAPQWRPMRETLLPEPERADLSGRYPKAVRRALETKWGFAGMLGELSRSGDPALRGFAGLAHGYSMASHVAHADHIGTSVPMEIERRPPDRRDVVLQAHGTRLMSDVMSCLEMRLLFGCRFTHRPMEPVAEALRSMNELRDRFGLAEEAWLSKEYPAR